MLSFYLKLGWGKITSWLQLVFDKDTYISLGHESIIAQLYAICYLPYLPVYNAHPYFEACFQKKKSMSVSSLSKNNFLEKFSRNVKSSSTCMKISYRSWCKSCSVCSMIHQVLWCFSRFLLLFRCCTIERDPFAQCL